MPGSETAGAEPEPKPESEPESEPEPEPKPEPISWTFPEPVTDPEWRWRRGRRNAPAQRCSWWRIIRTSDTGSDVEQSW